MMRSPSPSQESAYYTYPIRPVPNPSRMTFNADRILGGDSGRGSLWQGAASTVHVADIYGFDTIVLCAQEWQPLMSNSRIEVIRFLSDDTELTRAHLKEAIFISSKVERRVRAGKHVLCTCFAGYNRSGLVTALAVMKLTKKPGKEVVEYIQQKREGALCNESFARALRKLRPR
jgi:Dual specificity phosphatase, catalytic domain